LPSRLQVVSTQVSWQAKVHTFLMIDPHRSFSSAWGVLLFVAVVLCFRHVGAIHVCHLLFTFIVVHSCSSSALFVGAVNLAKEVVGNFHLLWIVRALVNWRGGVTYRGTSPLSSWVHPSICVIVIGSLSLLNLYRGCRICVVVIVKSASLSLSSNPCHPHR